MFSILKDGLPVYRPLKIESTISNDGEINVTVYNTSNTIVKKAGIFIGPSKNLGEAKYAPDMGPFIDYNHLLRWGTESISNGSYGGLKVTYDGETSYFSYQKGSNVKNKIPIGDIAPGNFSNIKLILEVPPNISSRRLFIGINVE